MLRLAPADDTRVTTSAQTQATPDVTTRAVAPAVAQEATGSNQAAPEEATQRLYEAALAKLDTMHERWAAALAAVREARAIDEPGGAAA